MKQDHTECLFLAGLDGSNPLAFLAALGTLRSAALEFAGSAITMHWQMNAGAWRPVLSCKPAIAHDEFVQRLHQRLNRMADHPAFGIADNLNMPASRFRDCASESAARSLLADEPDRTFADFVAAFGSDVCYSNDEPDPTIQDTALRTMSGAGHQHFLKFFRDLVTSTDPVHLRRALFEEWDYGDEGRGLNLRWDPADDRR